MTHGDLCGYGPLENLHYSARSDGKIYVYSRRVEVLGGGSSRIFLERITSSIMDTSVPLDPLLLERARRFDRSALAEIYDLYSPGLYRYALRLLGDANCAEDCVAETFSRFLYALQDGKGPRDFLQAYLYRIAHNWITDQYRRQAPIDDLDEDHWQDPAMDPERSAESNIRKARILTALRVLTPDQRQVISLKFMEDWDNDSIARAMHKPVGAIKSLQHRALSRLQQLLKEEVL